MSIEDEIIAGALGRTVRPYEPQRMLIEIMAILGAILNQSGGEIRIPQASFERHRDRLACGDGDRQKHGRAPS